MESIANHFPSKTAVDFRILHIQSQKISGVMPQGPRKNSPGAWTQTPISAWLASVPAVPVFYQSTTGSVVSIVVNSIISADVTLPRLHVIAGAASIRGEETANPA